MRSGREIRAWSRPLGEPLEGHESTEVERSADASEIVVAAERRQPGLMDHREQCPRLPVGGVFAIEPGEQTTIRRRLERVHHTPNQRVVEKRLPEAGQERTHGSRLEVAGQSRMLDYIETNAPARGTQGIKDGGATGE